MQDRDRSFQAYDTSNASLFIINYVEYSETKLED